MSIPNCRVNRVAFHDTLKKQKKKKTKKGLKYGSLVRTLFGRHNGTQRTSYSAKKKKKIMDIGPKLVRIYK